MRNFFTIVYRNKERQVVNPAINPITMPVIKELIDFFVIVPFLLIICHRLIVIVKRAINEKITIP